MKRMKKVIAIALVLCTIFALGACAQKVDATASKPAESKATESAKASESVKASTSAKKTLTMGTNAAFAPYEYKENNEVVGIDADIAKLIGSKIGVEVKIEDMEFDSIIPAVKSGKIDFGMAGMTVTDERKLSVDFSNTYATGKQVIIVKEGSPITAPDSLSGKTIGVQLATTGDIYITGDYEKKGLATVERYNKGADAVTALMQGKIDAVVIDNEPAKVFVQQNKGLKILETEYITEDYAIAVAKGNTELLNQINKALDELIKSGEIKKVLDKYIKAN